MKADYRERGSGARTPASGVPDRGAGRFGARVTPEERERGSTEAAGTPGGLVVLLESYTDTWQTRRPTTPRGVRPRQDPRDRQGPGHGRSAVPRDYPFGTKRPCVDTGYYETYNRDNVTLVDLRTTPLEEITAAGVRTDGHEYAVDAIVFATGFDAMTGALWRSTSGARRPAR